MIARGRLSDWESPQDVFTIFPISPSPVFHSAWLPNHVGIDRILQTIAMRWTNPWRKSIRGFSAA